MKKSIWLILNLSSWFLKQLTELTWTADCGRLFQRFRTLKEKKWSLASHLLCSFTSFHLWPRVRLPSANLKNVCSGTVEMPVTILNSSVRSARFLLSSSDQSLSNNKQIIIIIINKVTRARLQCSICLPSFLTTHSRRRCHSLMLLSMKLCDSFCHSVISLTSVLPPCQFVVCDKLLAEGHPKQRNPQGSGRGYLGATCRARWSLVLVKIGVYLLKL